MFGRIPTKILEIVVTYFIIFRPHFYEIFVSLEESRHFELTTRRVLVEAISRDSSLHPVELGQPPNLFGSRRIKIQVSEFDIKCP